MPFIMVVNNGVCPFIEYAPVDDDVIARDQISLPTKHNIKSLLTIQKNKPHAFEEHLNTCFHI
jgi:hypothetical protein